VWNELRWHDERNFTIYYDTRGIPSPRYSELQRTQTAVPDAGCAARLHCSLFPQHWLTRASIISKITACIFPRYPFLGLPLSDASSISVRCADMNLDAAKVNIEQPATVRSVWVERGVMSLYFQAHILVNHLRFLGAGQSMVSRDPVLSSRPVEPS